MKLRYIGPFDQVDIDALGIALDREKDKSMTFDCPDAVAYTPAQGDPAQPLGDLTLPEDQQVPYVPEHGLSLQEDFEVVEGRKTTRKGDAK